MTAQLTGPGLDGDTATGDPFVDSSAAIKRGHGRARETLAGLNFLSKLVFRLAYCLALIPGLAAIPATRRKMGVLTALWSTLIGIVVLTFIADACSDRGANASALVLAPWFLFVFFRGLAETIRGVGRIYRPAHPHIRRWAAGELSPWAAWLWLRLTGPFQFKGRTQAALDALAEPVLLLLAAGVYGAASFWLRLEPVALLCLLAGLSLLASDAVALTRSAWQMTLILDQQQEQAELASSLDRQASALHSRETEGVVSIA